MKEKNKENEEARENKRDTMSITLISKLMKKMIWVKEDGGKQDKKKKQKAERKSK